jgi:molybdopterin-dependent oxidoreductase alpha subunit
MNQLSAGGGWPAIRYALRKAREVGVVPLWRALRSKNTCKTCALGMGGQRGGMVNERGRSPEVCKKSLQAVAADLQAGIAPDLWQKTPLGNLQQMTPQQLERCGRLVQPLLATAGSDHYRPIAWDDALARIATRLRETPPDQTFWYFSGRSSNEAGFLLQLFARLYGTNNVNNCSYYCHQASGVGLTSSIGTGTATIALDDIEQADLVFLIGGNPASNHPRLMTTLKNVRRRGGQVIVINPLRELGLVRFRVPSDPWSLLLGTRIASLYVQPHIGGDLALLTGVAKRVDELHGQDLGFLQQHCDGVESWLEHLRQLPWPEIHAKSGVTAHEIDAIATRYIAARNVVFSWTMGITHHAHGVQNVQAIANLALMRGMLGRPMAGLLPIRGHSNVQGIGSVGVTPQLKDAVFAALEHELGVRLPTAPGRDTLACIEAAHAGQMRVGFCLGGNLFGSNPDARFAAEALARTDLMVYLNTSLNTGHAHGRGRETLVLPVLARDEEPQPTTQESMFNYVRMSDGGARRLDGPLSETELVARLAHQVLGSAGPIDWQTMAQTREIRQMISRVVPGWREIGQIDQTRREFYIDGRVLHTARFATASGRAQLHIHTLPELAAAPGELRLMTIRSEGQFNTVVYEQEDVYRGQERRDVVLLHPDDLQQLGLEPDQRVTVRSATGSMSYLLARPYAAIRPGNAAMYYPEANVLVARHADPKSHTPAFKCTLVSIEKC